MELVASPKFDSQGLQTYGELGHRISWPQPIAGATTALIADCQDDASCRANSSRRQEAAGSNLVAAKARGTSLRHSEEDAVNPLQVLALGTSMYDQIA